MDDETEVTPALEEEEDIELEADGGDEEETQEEDVEDIKARLAKAEELANNYKIRAEKAEKGSKTPKPASPELSPTDLYALMQANVPQDDISEVTEYAKLKKISVQEALKSTVIKTILSDNAEKRRTAEVTSTGTARRAGGKVTADSLLAKARKGEMPESDEDITRLVNARLGIKD